MVQAAEAWFDGVLPAISKGEHIMFIKMIDMG
jgi:hypothetical protein